MELIEKISGYEKKIQLRNVYRTSIDDIIYIVFNLLF
jgi:hypothetical protein